MESKKEVCENHGVKSTKNEKKHRYCRRKRWCHSRKNQVSAVCISRNDENGRYFIQVGQLLVSHGVYGKGNQILLRLLGQLQTENDYLQAAMDNLSKIPNNAIPGDIANQAKAIAISELSKNREKTNQKLLETYQKLYEDLRPFLFQENEV